MELIKTILSIVLVLLAIGFVAFLLYRYYKIKEKKAMPAKNGKDEKIYWSGSASIRHQLIAQEFRGFLRERALQIAEKRPPNDDGQIIVNVDDVDQAVEPTIESLRAKLRTIKWE